MSDGTIVLISALVGAAVTGLFAFFNVLFTSISNRKTKLIGVKLPRRGSRLQ